MKFIQQHFILLGLICYALTSCSQSTQSAPVAKASTEKVAPKSGYLFDVNQRPGGAAFYAMDSNTGALSYMLDFGETAGQWANYGNTIKDPGGAPLLFKAVNSEQGVTIYSMDSQTGQLFYMTDYGEEAGQWMRFGGLIRQNALNMLQFKLMERGNGNITFYAYDNHSHKTYYLNLYGDNAGKWSAFGNPYVEEK